MKSLNSPTKKVMIIAFSILFIVFLAWFGGFLHKYYTDHGEAMTYMYIPAPVKRLNIIGTKSTVIYTHMTKQDLGKRLHLLLLMKDSEFLPKRKKN